MTAPAEIFDRGYRRYEGERTGVWQAMRSVLWHTIRSVLGIGRKGRHKVFPALVALVAFLPSIAFLAFAVLIGDMLSEELRPPYWELFGLPILVVVLFATLVAPEALVRDRRDGMFRLYLSTPLTKPTYLLAKFAAVMAVMAIVVAGPVLLLLVGYTVQNLGPDGFGAWIGVLGRILLSSVLIVGFMAALSLGASSLTDRRAIASVGVLGAVVGVSIVVGICVDAIGLRHELRVLDPLGAPVEMAARIFGEVGPAGESRGSAATPTWLVFTGVAAWTTVWLSVLVTRYRRLTAV
jgi:ABC-2 type transport system permease protein